MSRAVGGGSAAELLVLIAFDQPVGTWTVGPLVALVLIVPALVAGWFACRECIIAMADERSGFTDAHSVIATRPAR